jgi:hypothetical protein
VTEELRRLVDGFQVSQAIHVVVTLGVPDLLRDGPRTSDELAEATGAHADALYRLLRALATVGVFREEEGRTFASTALGDGLRSDAAEPLAGWAAHVGLPYVWQAWAHLLHGVLTGENAFRHVHGVDIWEYRTAHPEVSAAFDRAMTDLSRSINRALLEAFDFARFETIVDVGGGRGALLAAILAAHPRVRGILFDQPHVVSGVELGPRGDVAGGSFFESVPEGGDAYLLKSVIHDWQDAEAAAILDRCRRAAREGAALLVVERPLRGPNEGRDAKFLDLVMLVAAGGRERTVEEYARLFGDAGFEFVAEHRAGAGHSVLEAVAR